MFLEVRNVSKSIAGNRVVKEVSFSQAPFKKIAIAGETGSGKSSLLKMVAGIVPPDTGEVWFEGVRLKKVPDEKLIPGHPGIAYLSQHFELQKFLTVAQILDYANQLPDGEAALLYKVCDIAHLLQRKTDQLSGGEKQRVALARLLTGSPRLLLLDEPFSNLDMIHKAILKNVIKDIGEKLGISCMMVSHEPIDTLGWADEIMVMREGRILQTGSPSEIYFQPLDSYVAGLFGRFNLFSPKEARLAFPDLYIEGRHMFIRPGSFEVALVPASLFAGQVAELAFVGTHYELVVIKSGVRVEVSTMLKGLSVGSWVSVSVSADEVWYM